MSKQIKLIFSILLIILLVGCNKCEDKLTNNPNYASTDVGTIKKSTEIEAGLPNFEITLLGNYLGNIKKDNLTGIKTYKVETIISANNKYYDVTFEGIKVKDFIEKVKFNDPNLDTIKFQGDQSVSKTYDFYKIDESFYFIYKMNDKPITVDGDTNKLTMINLREDSINWIYGLSQITVKDLQAKK